MPLRRSFPRVLCVACSGPALGALNNALKGAPFQVLSAATRSQAVAICVSESVGAIVIDGSSIRGPELSLAVALKNVRPMVPIILVEERTRLGGELPKGVDATVLIDAAEDLRATIERLLPKVDKP